MSIAVYIAVMALVTYLVRMVPFTVFRKRINSKFLRSVMYYLPYSVLSAMTFPAIFYSTGNVPASAVAAAVAFALSYAGLPLILVAVIASLAALIFGFVF